MNWYFIAIPPLKDVFRTTSSGIRYIDDSPATYLTQLPSPSLNTVELIVIHNCPCEHSLKLQLSIRFTPSRCLDVRQDWYPMYYPEGMKAWVSPVQSIEPHRILAPTRDLNRESLGPQSRVVTTILPLRNMGWAAMSNKMPGCHLANAWRRRSKHILQWRYRNEVSVQSINQINHCAWCRKLIDRPGVYFVAKWIFIRPNECIFQKLKSGSRTSFLYTRK